MHISAKPVGVGAASQRLIAAGERSGLQISTDIYRVSRRIKAPASRRLTVLFGDKHQMQHPAARILFRILRERDLQSLREDVNHVLAALRRALITQIHEQTWFVRRLEKAGVRCCKSLGVTILLKAL
jgi:hypothetical protein